MCLPINVGRLIPLYPKQELTLVQVTLRPSLGRVHFLSSNDTSLLSVSKVVSAIVIFTTGRDLRQMKEKLCFCVRFLMRSMDSRDANIEFLN